MYAPSNVIVLVLFQEPACFTHPWRLPCSGVPAAEVHAFLLTLVSSGPFSHSRPHLHCTRPRLQSAGNCSSRPAVVFRFVDAHRDVRAWTYLPTLPSRRTRRDQRIPSLTMGTSTSPSTDSAEHLDGDVPVTTPSVLQSEQAEDSEDAHKIVGEVEMISRAAAKMTASAEAREVS